MPGPLFLEGETIELRPIEEEDADFLQGLINDPRVRDGLGASGPINRSQEEEWIESIGEEDSDMNFLITVDSDPVGSIGYHSREDVWGNVEVGYSMDPEQWGNGYTTDALRQVCRFAFEERRRNKVVARAFETNAASNRVLEKVGFEHEGTFRNEAYVGGEYIDIYRYGLLAEAFDT